MGPKQTSLLIPLYARNSAMLWPAIICF